MVKKIYRLKIDIWDKYEVQEIVMCVRNQYPNNKYAYIDGDGWLYLE